MPGRNDFGFRRDIDLNGSLNDLPGKINLEIRTKLDTNPADKDWRALARAVEKEYRIKYELFDNFSLNLLILAWLWRKFLQLI